MRHAWVHRHGNALDHTGQILVIHHIRNIKFLQFDMSLVMGKKSRNKKQKTANAVSSFFPFILILSI